MRNGRAARVAGVGLALFWSVGAVAQAGMAAPAPDCAARPATLPPEYAAWTTRTPRDAATSGAGLVTAMLVLNQAVTATLPPTAAVDYGVPPQKPGGAASFGGLLGFDVADAGVYRVVLGSAAWIDLVEGGNPVASTGHGHGPDCSGIRKIVDFPLKPGRHVLQISGNADAATAVMVMRLP